MLSIIMAAISANSLVNVVVWIIAAGLIFWLLTWLIDYVGLPEPFSKIAKVIVAVIAVLMLINAIMSLAGNPLIVWR